MMQSIQNASVIWVNSKTGVVLYYARERKEGKNKLSVKGNTVGRFL